MHHSKSHKYLILIAIAASTLFFSAAPQSVSAVKATDFNAANIIDDAIFYNKDAMTLKQIEDFLKAKTPACDTWGTKPVGGGRYINGNFVDPSTPRHKYAEMMRAAGNTNYHAPPYICLTNYYENPSTRQTSFDTNAEKTEGMLSAAEIIYYAAQTYNINPQVLLVTLRKEYNYILTDDWPIRNMYNTVMGYACPDTGPGNTANCDSKHYGFYNQMTNAAWQIDRYKQNAASFSYRPNRNNYIQYSPDASCGGKQVYIENFATAALYNYTPYTPNPGALAAWPGTATCGAYGNRNFFMFFNEWFGPTQGTSIGTELQERYEEIKDLIGPAISQAYRESDGRQWQTFQNGTIIYHPDTGAWEVLNGVIHTRWAQLGGSLGTLGKPKTGANKEPDGRQWQTFENGVVIYHADTGSWEVLNGMVHNRWAQLGGSLGTLGKPKTGTNKESDGRQWQTFENGVVIYHSSTGAWEVMNGVINTKWGSLGGSLGILGKPASTAQEKDGWQWQDFEKGGMVINDKGLAISMQSPELYKGWKAALENSVHVGLPIDMQRYETDMRQWQTFENGTIVFHPTTGAWAVTHGAIYNYWAQNGGSLGKIGRPISNQVRSEGDITQKFQNGTVVYDVASSKIQFIVN